MGGSVGRAVLSNQNPVGVGLGVDADVGGVAVSVGEGARIAAGVDVALGVAAGVAKAVGEGLVVAAGAVVTGGVGEGVAAAGEGVEVRVAGGSGESPPQAASVTAANTTRAHFLGPQPSGIAQRVLVGWPNYPVRLWHTFGLTARPTRTVLRAFSWALSISEARGAGAAWR